MDEILASIRRIIEGREESETPAEKPQDRALKSVSDKILAEAPRAEVRSSEIAPEQTIDEEVETKSEKHVYAALEDGQRNTPIGLKAVNDEGKTPFAGAKISEVERQVASQMEELATVSVARMRAASLEDAVRGFRKYGAEDVETEAGEKAEIGAQAFSDEFDEAAFATELLINAGLMDEPVSQPETVTSAEAVKLRLAYPESPAEGEVEAEASLETAIGAATDLPKQAASTATVADDQQESGIEASVEAATRGALVSMISDTAEDKIQSSFTELAAVLRDEQAQRMDATVREMLQPMLSDWLEDNLPVIVERLVREEIERVARGPKRA
ncbi:DUF2497 domain-containing protein [Fulvimarina sp. MAC8]|uniref:PopZ family protein n=1 Tax=Fulvimarina sp. MAC8 TaxID=3162874 RepID=UPI0032EF05D1